MLAVSLWIRAGVVAALVLFLSVAARDASAVVVCSNFQWDTYFVANAACPAGPPCVTRNTSDLYPTTGPVATTIGFKLSRDTGVTLGTPCGSDAVLVLMTKGDYQVLIDGAGVVTKLQEGYDLGTIALAILCLLVGFWFGWKAVQRGSSQ